MRWGMRRPPCFPLGERLWASESAHRSARRLQPRSCPALLTSSPGHDGDFLELVLSGIGWIMLRHVEFITPVQDQRLHGLPKIKAHPDQLALRGGVHRPYRAQRLSYALPEDRPLRYITEDDLA